MYRGDDGGQTWRANYFQDSRFQSYNVALDGETASCGKCFKGGETPFGEAICNADPNRVIPVRNEPHITQDGGATWFGGHAYPVPGQKPGPRSAKACNGLVVDHHPSWRNAATAIIEVGHASKPSPTS